MNIYTIIRQDVRRNLDLSLNEYCVADSIYHLSNNPKNQEQGWAYITSENLGKVLGLTSKTILRIIRKLRDMGLVETNGHLKKTTERWYNEVISSETVIEQGHIQKKDKMSYFEKSEKKDKMSYNKDNIYTNTTNNNNISILGDKMSQFQENRKKDKKSQKSIKKIHLEKNDKKSELSKTKKFFLMIENQEKELETFIKQLSEATNMTEEAIAKELKLFTLYWTEKNENGKKERWEKQKTFDVKRRLFTWLNNKKTNFGKNNETGRSKYQVNFDGI